MSRYLWVLVLVALMGASGGGGASDTVSAAPAATVQEGQCVARGWQRMVIQAAGLQRVVLWKGPAGAWTRGALVVMHGGGGQHANFCVANLALIEPQVRFTDLALAQGLAVFLPESTAIVSDTQGRLRGKVWDDKVGDRANLDLPFMQALLDFFASRLN